MTRLEFVRQHDPVIHEGMRAAARVEYRGTAVGHLDLIAYGKDLKSAAAVSIGMRKIFGQGIRLDALEVLPTIAAINDDFDKTLRADAFWTALHVSEARWLVGMGALRSPGNGQQTVGWDYAIEEYRDLRKMALTWLSKIYYSLITYITGKESIHERRCRPSGGLDLGRHPARGAPRLLKEAAMLVRARKAVLESGDWLTAADIAQLAGLSTRNPSAQPNKWKKQGQIFAIHHGGVDYFPGYGLDRDTGFRPVKALARIIKPFDGHKDGWGMAYWFRSDNSFLGGKRPQDLLASEPERVVEAAMDEVQEITHG